MYKLLIGCMIWTYVSLGFAQSVVTFQPTETNTTAPSANTYNRKPLSPDEFRQKVQVISVQKSKELEAAANKHSSLPSNMLPNSTNKPQTTTPLSTTPAMPVTPNVPEVKPTPVEGTSPSAQPKTTAPNAAPTSSKQKPNVYTGFPTNNTQKGTTTNSGTTQQSNGWNINY